MNVLRHFAQVAQECQTIHLGHRKVKQDQLRGMLLKRGEGVFAVASNYDRMSGAREYSPEKLAAGRIIVDNEDGAHVRLRLESGPIRNSLPN
jgi:hypothetical protein